MDQQVDLKIKIYCRPNEIFQLSASPETTLGQIVIALKENADISDLPNVDKLNYVDSWSSPINHETTVDKLVPFHDEFEISVEYNEQPKSNIQFYPDQSGFFVNQQSQDIEPQQKEKQQVDPIDKKQHIIQDNVEQFNQLKQFVHVIQTISQSKQPDYSMIKKPDLRDILRNLVNTIRSLGNSLNSDIVKSIKDDYQVQLSNKDAEIRDLQTKVNHIRENNNQKQLLIDDLKNQIQKLQNKQNQDNKLDQLKNALTNNQHLKKQIIALQHQLSQVTKEYQIFKAQNAPKKLKPLNKEAKQEKQNQPPISTAKTAFCTSSILYENDHDGQMEGFLNKCLSEFQQAKIKKVELIYKMDIKNRTNFHLYLDNRKHLLLLFQTKAGNLFGGYLRQGLTIDEFGGAAFLFSLNYKIMFLKNTELSVAQQYELSYIVLGNSDIVIKFGSNNLVVNSRIFSKHSSFKAQTDRKHDIFTGSRDKNEVELQTYQIYEVTFDK